MIEPRDLERKARYLQSIACLVKDAELQRKARELLHAAQSDQE